MCAQVGNDASQFVGPVFLNLLLAAMQNGESAWKGYLYGVSIFLGVVSHRPFNVFISLLRKPPACRILLALSNVAALESSVVRLNADLSGEGRVKGYVS
jgi:hypothetical protein